MTDSHATRRVAEEIARSHPVTTLVHNAGAIHPALLPEVKLEDLGALVNLHLSAALLLLQATLPAMKAAGFGRVVLVSSRAVLGLPTRTAYATTKAGMLGMADPRKPRSIVPLAQSTLSSTVPSSSTSNSTRSPVVTLFVVTMLPVITTSPRRRPRPMEAR